MYTSTVCSSEVNISTIFVEVSRCCTEYKTTTTKSKSAGAIHVDQLYDHKLHQYIDLFMVQLEHIAVSLVQIQNMRHVQFVVF